MDEYGHSAAARAGIRMFEMGSHRTGRTMRLIERLTDNDQVVVPTQQIADWFRRKLREAGKIKTKVYVVEPGKVPMERVGTASQGRTFFDHTWTQAHFERALDRAAEDLEHFQRAMSKTWPEKPTFDPKLEPQIREFISL